MSPPRAATLALAVAALAGCSAEQLSMAPPTTSRMTKPSVIPDVTLDAPQATQTQPSGEFVDIPQQIWVRSVGYAKGMYTLKIATAPGGTFTVIDSRAVGGLSETDAADGMCDTTKQTKLAPPIVGALKNVTTLVTLTCRSAKPMKKPYVSGTWGNETSGGHTAAYFVLGPASAQGRPDERAQVDLDRDPVDVDIVSIAHSGTALTVEAWATEYVQLSVAPGTEHQSSTTTWPECLTEAPTRQRAGVKNSTRQRLFRIRCTGVSSLDGMALTYSHEVGEPGGEPMYAGAEIALGPDSPQPTSTAK